MEKNEKEQSINNPWQLICIIDELAKTKRSMKGTECLLLTMCEAFTYSKRTMEDFIEAVHAIHDLLGVHIEQLEKVESKLNKMLKSS